jgi:hypothetical protein
MKSDDRISNTFHVFLCSRRNIEPPDWNLLQQSSTIHTVIVQGGNFVQTDQVMPQIALAIRRNGSAVKAIRFTTCRVHPLWQLWDAMTSRSSNNNGQQQQKLTFEFACIRFDTHIARTLQLMLKSDHIENISFLNCAMDIDAALIVAEGIRPNRSLRTFSCYADRTTTIPNYSNTITDGVCDMLQHNQNLFKLALTIGADDDDNGFWTLFRSVKDSQTLQSLELRYSPLLNLQNVEAIVLVCFTINSLKDLCFIWCSFRQDAMEFLVQVLSHNKIIDTLTFENVCFFYMNHADSPPMTMSFGNLQVQKLSLSGTRFEDEAFLQTITDVVNNPYLQSLDLSQMLYNEFACQTVVRLLLQANRGPSELLIGGLQHIPGPFELILIGGIRGPVELPVGGIHHESLATVILEALQHNTSVKALTISDMHNDDILTFTHGLRNMIKLRKLDIIAPNIFDCKQRFLQTLQESLEQNTSLCQLSIDGVHSSHDIMPYLSRIRYLLATNLVGRHTLMATPNVPVGLWVLVLARSSTKPDGIYFALTEKPDIISEST